MQAPLFKAEQWVTWTDPDEEGFIKPHVGMVLTWDEHDGFRVYFVQESKTQFQLVLEEELSPLTRED